MAYYVTLINMPENRRVEFGPFAWTCITYNELRAESMASPDEDTTLAVFHNGFWCTEDMVSPMHRYTDIDIDWEKPGALHEVS